MATLVQQATQVPQAAHGLHAKMAGGNTGEDSDTEADSHSRAEGARGENRVEAVEGGEHRRHPGPCVFTN